MSFIKNIFLLFLFFYSANIFAHANCNKPFELSTSGRNIVDQCGDKFKLKAVNWSGAQYAFEVVGGLNKQPLDKIVELIKSAGFNAIRLPFSNRMLHNVNSVDKTSVAANPQFFYKTPLQVLDAVIKALTDVGIVVILNNHTTLSEWCCGYDFNGIWHHPNYQSTAQWISDWEMLAARYKDNPLVAGFDLRNEVRTARFADTIFPVYPNWGLGDENDWRLAATNAGNAIHNVNPHLLIIVEGINWTGVPMVDGYRPLLVPIRDNPMYLNQANKLVYEVHSYGYTGPKHTGDDIASAGETRYRDMDEATLRAQYQYEFGYILENGKNYTAPVWLGEFGTSYKDASAEEKLWFKNMTQYLLDHDMGWSVWSLNGERADGSEEPFGLLDPKWQKFRAGWRGEYLVALLRG